MPDLTLDQQRDRLVADHHRLESEYASIELSDSAGRRQYLRRLQEHATRLRSFHDGLKRYDEELRRLPPDPEEGHVMKTLVLNLPTFGFVVATRAMLGVGIGLLLSERLPAEKRHAVALTLIAVGAATTVPAIAAVLGGTQSAKLQAV